MKPGNTLTRLITLIIFLLFLQVTAKAQSCTPAGDQVSFGTGDVWRGYVYSGIAFDTYRGYLSVGTAGNFHFDHNFGGSQVNFTTNGCSVYSENFSVRFKLRKTFTNQNVQFAVGGDDGFRLSIDGGATWLINRWNDQGYTTVNASIHLNGTYDLVLEYYERGGDNRISISSTVLCTGTGDPSVYGTNNVWRGYIYQGMNFESYRGFITKGTAFDANFDENFGGDNVTISSITCPITTQAFSARFRLTKNLPAGSYMFTVSGDDGYRLSFDGGTTWVINRWFDQAFATTSISINLAGTYNRVLEYYENSGSNRINFAMSVNSVLPVKLVSFTAAASANDNVRINWTAAAQQNFNKFIVQAATDGRNFKNIGEIKGGADSIATRNYSLVDRPTARGKLYYRLAMVDLDGTTRYSPIVSVTLLHLESARVFPSLVVNKQLSLEAPVTLPAANVELFDPNGRRLYSKTLPISYGRQQLPADLLTATSTGTYIVRVSSQTSVIVTQRIVIQ